MHKRLLSISTLLCLLPLTSPIKAAYWSPHIGADAVYWGVKPYFPYDEVFPRLNKAGNLYVGTRINGIFGIDLGYEVSTRKQLSKVYQGGEIIFVSPENPGDATNITVRLRGPHVDFNFYWEVVKRLEILMMAGVAFITPDTDIFHLTNGVWLQYHNQSDQKVMGRFGFGLQFNPIPCLGIKGLMQFEPAVRFNNTGVDQNNDFYDIHPYKSAVSYKLGIVYSFSKPRRGSPVFSQDKWGEEDL